MNQHLTVLVAWHQEQWNGRVYRSASSNPFCQWCEATIARSA
jgi:hypothetical protein